MINKVKKVNIFIDTNILENNNKKLYEFKFNELYNKLKKFVKYNGYDNLKFNIIIPQIVLDELNKHYLEEYERIENKLKNIDKEYNELKSDLNKLGYNFNIEKKNYNNLYEYTEYLKRKFAEYLEKEKENFEIISYPSSDKFYNIINRSIQKERPFFSGNSNGKKFSDAGFKDVIFVESIIEKMAIDNAEYIIVTNDKIVNGLDWTKEIKDRKGKATNSNTNTDVIDFICNEYGLDNKFEYIEFSQGEYFTSRVNEVMGNKTIKDIQNVKIVEDGDAIIIEVECTMNNGDNIIVSLDEVKEFLDIRDLNDEIIYQWE